MDWHKIWHTCSDVCGNEHELNKVVLRDPMGAFGSFRGLKNQKSGKSTKRLNRFHQIFYNFIMSADSSWNGHRLKQLAHRDPRMAFSGF